VTRRLLLIGALSLAAVSPAFGQEASGASLRGDCQDRLAEYLKKPSPGYFFYVEAPGSRKYACDGSVEERGEFDRYPGSAQRAFTACQNAADDNGITARCEAIARGPALVARSYAEAQARDDAAGLVRDAMRCGQLPLGRWFWVERAFCDMRWHGAASAKGVVIWNHGIHGTVAQHAAPVPPVLRLLQARGWDVVKIARNNLGETTGEQSLNRAVRRTQEEIAARRREGYGKVVLAGQSFGGYITLETAEASRDVYGVVAMAPGIRFGGTGNLDTSVTERTLGALTVDRLALVFPRNDTLFGSQVRGPGAARVLARRGGSFLLLDETLDIVDHGGGTTGKFAVRYGPCLVRYLTSPEVGKGAVGCPESMPEQRRAAEELLPRLSGTVKLAPASDRAAAEGGALLGKEWYGILEPSAEVVSFAIVDVDGVGRRAMFGVASGGRRGGLYPLSTGEPGVTFRVADRGTVTVKGTTLTWTATGGRASHAAKLHPLAEP
jgi:pimeloyl-ACP methyl ester carboxylesterase